MEFIQSRMATKIDFKFEDDELVYAMKDNTSELSFDVAYEKIPKRSQVFHEKNLWLRNVGYIWVALGAGFTLYNIFVADIVRMSFWFWIGLGCLAFYKFTQSEYAYFDTEEGRVLVLKDGNYQEIMSQIVGRRKEAYLDWFNRLEFENGDQIERALEYLVQEKVLTKAEASEKQELMIIPEEKRRIGFQSSNPPDQIH